MPCLFTLSRSSILAGLTTILLAACGGGNSSVDPEGPPPDPTPPPRGGAATAVGHAVGTATSQTIGAAGGRLILDGGQVTLDVPEGALAQDTLITIQPITNYAHGGAGQAYRFGPEDVYFTKPVSITFRYSEGDAVGSSPEALGVAFQRTGGIWEWTPGPVLDSTAHQVSVTTKHFSDWSLVRGIQLLPSKAVVPAGKTQGVRVLYCYPGFDENDLLAPLGDTCSSDTPATSAVAGSVKEWAVNGKAGGSAALGTITESERGGATYTAPSNVPSPATVTVSARIERKHGGQILVLSDITIADDGDYAGTAQFSTSQYSGTAQVSWKLVEDDGHVSTYGPSGTMDLDIHMKDCDHVRRTISIDNAYVAGGLNSFMQVFNSNVVEFPKTHVFVLSGRESVTLQCGTPRLPREVPGHIFMVEVGACNGLRPQPYADKATLSGQFSCPTAGLEEVTWTFQAQR